MATHNLYSSLHDDFLYPYDAAFSHAVGLKISKKEFVRRAIQCGIHPKDILKRLFWLSHISQERYRHLIKNSLAHSYDIAFPSIFAWWYCMSKETQMSYIRHAVEWYKQLGFTIAHKGDDIRAPGPYLVLSIEGADCVESMDDIRTLHRLGIGSIMLQYFEPNALVSEKGLTPLGAEAVEYLLHNKIIVDLAHQNPKARTDIFSIAERLGKGHLLAYTHGSTVEDIERCALCYPERGLTMQEVERLLKLGGIMGLGVTKPFFGSVDELAERIHTIAQLQNGTTHVALGTDFGGVSAEDHLGIDKPSDLRHLAEMLKGRYHYSDELIQNILCTNIRRWLGETDRT